MNNFIKLTIVAIFFVILAVPAEAKRVEPEKAKKLAQNFVESKRGHWAKADIRLKHTAKKRKQKREQEETTLYYVFNVNEAQGSGFVIVAGDDAAKPVLGYSESGNYDENNVPPNFAYWMDYLGEQIAWAQEQGLAYSAPYDHGYDEWAAVSPLIQTHWHQVAPYNNMTPEYEGQHSVTGCVATAMAQIMKYWNHPVQGTGSSQAYITSTHGISVPSINFGATTYDWQNMQDTYLQSRDDTPQNNAVATLMYHVGASVRMNYTPDEGSGAPSANVATALRDNFGYDNSIQRFSRQNYDDATWENILREQINAGMPVYYDGFSDESGHAFVLDGYDNTGKFHFNWGWGGRDDGYFVTTALTHSYNQRQTITINIKPKNAVAPSITLPPSNQTVQAGDSAQFTVAATPTGALTYQWQVSTNKIPVKDTIFRENFEGSNSFTVVNGSETNKWVVGTAIAAQEGTKSAYISNNGSSNALTTTSPSIVHMYRDVTFPVFEACTLWFYVKGISNTDNDLAVRLVETSFIPTDGALPSGGFYSYYRNNYDDWTLVRYVVNKATAGTTKRVIFTWRNDGSTGINPPIAVDNIAIVATNSKFGETYFRNVSDGTGGTTATYKTMATEAMSGYRYRSIVKSNNGLPAVSNSATLMVTGTIPKNYIINGSGTTFTATKKGLTVGTANQSIANVIADIRIDAAGNDCTIQFGDGISPLDIGTNNITFDGSGSLTWGLITLKGKITSSSTSTSSGTIFLSNGSFIESTADIANTASGNAIYNNSTGFVSISGGTISAATGRAVYNNSTGKITVSGTANVTSANVSSSQGTIYNSTGTVEITGGTVENTAASANARAIYNASTGAVNISGGTVSATSSGRAVHNNSTGTVTIGGGTVLAPAGYAVYSMDASSSVVLGGNPSIIGSIATASEKLSLAANFAPVSKTYTLAFASYTNGSIAVPNGKNYLSSFKLRQCYALKAEGENLVIDEYLGTCPKPTTTYAINGSGTAFTATKNGVVIGTADQTISNVISAIQTDVAGYDCVIQFGDGTSTLDIGTNYISFSGNINLGVVTLAGKITSSSTSYTILLSNGSSIESTADITNTSSGNAVYNNGIGFVSISGGTISATTGRAVYNNSTGAVSISGGTVQATGTGDAIYNNSTGAIAVSNGTISATSGRAIRNNSTATVTISGGTFKVTTGYTVTNESTGSYAISGGTLSATTGYAVYNASTGKITVSGTAKVTSANVTGTQGTIYLRNEGTETAERLAVIGGTVENTADNANARAIYNASTGAVNISGGEVSATTGYAVYNNSTGAVNVSDGTISAPAGYAVYSMNENSSVVLDGNPSITGSIATTFGKLSLAANFAPVSKTYTLAFASYTNGSIAVPNGKNYLSSFKLRQCYALKAEGENLVIDEYLGTCPKPTTTYIINGNGTAFTATKNGVVVGTADQTITNVITAIQTDAAGYDCVIQFGDGTSTLDIGSSNISFSGNNINLGVVTLAGKITSSNTNTISLSNGSSIEITADIANTSGRAVYNDGTGFVNISGGTISATTSYAVRNNSTGTVNISGGEVSATTGSAVYNASTGAVNISGGEVKTTTGSTVFNNSTGKITVSGTAKVTSANVSSTNGTIVLVNSGTETAERLAIIGGTVENTADNTSARAIYNASTGAVNISGGEVKATAGSTVYNNSTGAVTISGGEVKATAGSAVYNNSTGVATISGGEVKVTTGSAVYNNSTGTVIVNGGTVTGGYAVYSMNENSSVVLGGNPSINGSIATTFGKLSIAANFAPVSKTYTLAFASYPSGSVAVTSGKDYLSNFKLRQCYALKAEGENLVIGEYLGTCPKPTTTYAINGSGTTFTATKNGGVVGTANQPIANVITAIRTDAAGNDCIIQFGDGTSTLDIGSNNIAFDGGIAWGVVTLAGKITSSNTNTISLSNGSSIESTADIANTNASGRAVYHNGTGLVNISSGEVLATTGYAVYNASTGAVNISGGTVLATTTGRAVHNNSTGAVNISGGEVSATTGYAVYNNSTGKITVSGTATKVTSANVTNNQGTIYLRSDGTETAERLAIIGGTVENTADDANARAIYNASTGAVNISGGTVSAATTGRAVHNNSTGTVTISDGTLSATTGYAVYNASTGAVNISGGTVSATSSGRAVHNNSTGTVNISGGEVKATAGYAVYNNSTGVVNISGGTISAPANYAVYSMNANSSVVLGGNPSITGSIATASEKLSLAANFAPVSKTYTLAFASYTNGSIAVPKGKNYLSSFKLRQCYALKAEGENIVIDEYLGTCPKPTTTYIINGSGTTFTATKNGVVVGTADQPIANVISAIQTDVAGYDCVIQFGDGTSTLDIGSGNISFSGNINLGVVTLAGKITSTNASITASGTISLSNGASIESAADIANTSSGNAVFSSSTGFVSISGGEVSAATGNAVRNNSTGAVNISGGTVSATTTTGRAVYNTSTGKITVSGTAKVTSANVTSNSGTIIIGDSGTETDERLAVTGGTVENTAASTSARAIYNNSTGAVNISGGTVMAKDGYAIYRNNGTITLTGGVVFAYGTAAYGTTTTSVIYSSTAITPSGNVAIVAWNKSAGTTTYTALDNTNIFALSPTTARWDMRKGIYYANSGNTGFIPIDVTVNKITPTTPTGLTATYGQTLADVSLPAGWAWVSSTTTSVGNAGTPTHTAKYTPTDTENYNTLASVSLSITVNKAAGTFPSTAAVSTTYTPTLKLSDVTLPANYVWATPTTALIAGNDQTFAATYTDPSGNYNAVSGNVTVNVAKAAGTFPTATALNTTYTTTLKLSDLTLPANYAWAAPTTSLTAGNDQTFPATYTDPSGNYNAASGNITVNVAKAAGTFLSTAAVSTTYTPTLKLSDVTLPANYAWAAPTTVLTAGNNQTFAATYTDPSGNYNAVSGNVTVNVAKAAGTFPTTTVLNTTYTTTLKLSDLTLPTNYAWATPTTALTAGNDQTFAATYTDPSGNYDAASGNVTVNVAKAAGTFPTTTALNTTYTTTLKLSDLTLPANYAWAAPTTALTAGNDQIFAATYTDPSGNYDAASGNITVNVAKSAGTFPTTTALNTTYTPTLKLSDVTLPANYAWAAPTTSLTAGNNQTFAAIYTDPSGNYDAASGNITVNVAKAAGTFVLTHNISSVTYDGNPHSVSVTAAQDVTGLGAITVKYNGSTAVPTKTGTYAVTVDVAEGTNFAAASGIVLGEYKINPKPVTITGISASNKVYDGNTTATVTGTGAVAGKVGSDNVTVTIGTASFANKTVGTGKTVTFSGFSLGGTDASNYTLSAQPTSVTANITAKPITITVTSITASNKEYDGTTTAEVHGNVTISGEVSGDDVTIVKGNASFNDKNVGTNKPVTFSGFSLSGADVNNYTISVSEPISITANITTKPITITGVTAIDRAYNGTTTVTLTGGTLVGVKNGDAVGFTLGTGTVTTSSVGNNKLVATNITLTGTDAGNYSLTQPTNVTVSITSSEIGISSSSGNVVSSSSETSVSSSSSNVVSSSSGIGDSSSSNNGNSSSSEIDDSSSSNNETPILPNRENPIIGRIGVQTKGYEILLSNLPQSAKVQIYNLQGKQIYSANSENSSVLVIPVQTKGMYIVKIGSQTIRAVVR